MSFPEMARLYAILDGAAVRAAGFDLLGAAEALRAAGIRFLQYRDKDAAETDLLENARAIGSIFHKADATLVLNDWPEIAVAAGWHGVHVGQGDMPVSEARRLVGGGRLVGVSTHSLEQFRSAVETTADYIAYGPIFRTTTKQDAEPPVGLPGLQQVRKLSQRSLVAIGGISSERMKSVFAAGADSVAVIGALFQREQSVQDAAAHLLRMAEFSR